MNGKSIKKAISLLALLVSAFSALILSVLPVHAASSPLYVDPMDNPLKISRMLNSSTTTFGGDIRLTALEGDISNLRLLASDLQMMNDACPSTPPSQTTSTSQPASTIIDRSNISIPAGTALKHLQPNDVLVTITNVAHPGTYCGFLDFYDGQTGAKLLTVPLTLSVSASPNVTSLDDTVTVQLVHNQWPGADNALVNIVLSNSYEQDTWTVRLLNQTLVPVNILGMTLDLKGDKTGVDYSPVAKDAFPSVNFPLSLPANQIKTINFSINGGMLPPDHYHGMIRLILANSDSAVKVPVDINLRNGPFWPILLLILGILLGRLAVNLASPIAIKQNALREHANDVSIELLQIKDSGARNDVATKLKEDIQGKIYSTNQEDRLKALDNLLDKLEARISFYKGLDIIQDRITQQVTDAHEQGMLLDRVYKLRSTMQNVVVDGETANLVDQLNPLRTDLNNWVNHQNDPARLESLAATRIEFGDLLNGVTDDLATIGRSPAPLPVGQQGNWLGQLLISIIQFIRKLWGNQAERAERRDVWLRPMMKWFLVIVLALIGLETLYLSNATFGASGLLDYFPLILWGFGSNVAGSSFQNLPLPSGRG